MPEKPERRAEPRPSSNKTLGDSGEHIVAEYLKGLGWQVLATKYRCRQGEIDVIAEEAGAQGKILAFIEVKTRRSNAHGTPIEAVNARKREKLWTVAQHYLAERAAGGEEPACRFDIAEVFIGADGLARVVLQRGVFGLDF